MNKEDTMSTVYLISLIIIFISGIYAIYRLIRWLIKKLKNKASEPLQKDFEAFHLKLKWRRWIQTLLTSLLLFAVLFALFYKINSLAMQKAFFRASDEARDIFVTQKPNVFANDRIVDRYGNFSSSLKSDSYKDIDGYRLPWETYRQAFGTLDIQPVNKSSIVSQGNSYYTSNQSLKVASFFMPKVNYHSEILQRHPQPSKDADKIARLNNSLAEVAVSFDKPYSYKEIQKMIPENLLINWYWLGYQADRSQDAAQSQSYFGLSSSPTYNQEGQYEGLSGKLDDSKDYQPFVQAVKRLAKTGQSKFGNFSPSDDALKQVEAYPDLNKAKFSGLILTGRTESFAGLDQKPWAYATNVGLTTSIRPDVQPTK